MTRLEERVTAWFLEPSPAHWAVLGRVGFGLVVLCGSLALFPWWQELFGPAGLAGVDTRIRLFGEDAVDPSLSGWLRLDSIRDPTLTWGLFVASVSSAACFAAGFRTRTAGFITLMIHVALVGRHGQALNGGWPFMLHQYLVYLLLADCGRYASVDAWLRCRREGGDWLAVGDGPNWPKRLFMVHICALYAVAGFHRFTDAGWLEGSMVFVAMTYAMYTKWPTIDWFSLKPLLMFANWAAFVIEPAAVVLLWVPRLKTVMLALLFALHVGLEVTTRTGWWNYVMGVSLLVFIDSALLSRGWTRSVTALRTSRDTGAAASA